MSIKVQKVVTIDFKQFQLDTIKFATQVFLDLIPDVKHYEDLENNGVKDILRELLNLASSPDCCAANDPKSFIEIVLKELDFFVPLFDKMTIKTKAINILVIMPDNSIVSVYDYCIT